jgi:hypothetical protein
MMMFKKLLICITFLVLFQQVKSESDDFGIWYGINGTYSVTKKLDISVLSMLRTFDNCSKTEQIYLEPGISYKINKYFAIGGSYRLVEYRENNSEFHIRHKFLADIKNYLSLGNFSFSTRFRFQVQKLTYILNESDEQPTYEGRIKLKVNYNISKSPVNPYLSVESFSPMFADTGLKIDKARYAAGFEYRIAKKHSVAAEYIFQREYLPVISGMNIISLSYNFKF